VLPIAAQRPPASASHCFPANSACIRPSGIRGCAFELGLQVYAVESLPAEPIQVPIVLTVAVAGLMWLIRRRDEVNGWRLRREAG